MKFISKLILINIIFILIMGSYNLVYGVDKFVDIPIPPNSSGKADFTSEEGEKEAKQYETNEILRNAILNNNTEETTVISENNYLKSLNVDGFVLEPQFNKNIYEYTIYLLNKSEIASLNIEAKPEDDTAIVEGDGNVFIDQKTNTININVIAENGNLKVYTIKINSFKNEEKNKYVIIFSIIIIVGILGIIIMKIF